MVTSFGTIKKGEEAGSHSRGAAPSRARGAGSQDSGIGYGTSLDCALYLSADSGRTGIRDHVVSLSLILAAKIISKTSGAMKRPKAEGETVRSGVVKLAQRERRLGQFNFSTRRTIDMYVPRVVYAYEVDGNQYQGDDLGRTSSANTTAPAEKCIRRYPLHARVQVSYDPADPSRSTLAPSAGVFPLVLLLLAALAALAAFALGWLMR